MARGGRPKTIDGPERRCIATGKSQGTEGLLRFVVGPGGEVVPDLLERLPGRGIWVSADRSALEKAVSKRLFSRAAKQAVTIPDGLLEAVDAGLARRVTELISLARKAGEAVTGLEKVKGWLLDGTAALLVQASDGSVREQARLRPPSPQQPDKQGTHIRCLTAGELGFAFGRERVIHAALSSGGLARQVQKDSARLARVRS